MSGALIQIDPEAIELALASLAAAAARLSASDKATPTWYCSGAFEDELSRTFRLVTALEAEMARLIDAAATAVRGARDAFISTDSGIASKLSGPKGR